jgi:hypothetical protein
MTANYDETMMAALRVWGNSESDDLETEVMAWALNEILRLRAALRRIANQPMSELQLDPTSPAKIAAKALLAKP